MTRPTFIETARRDQITRVAIEVLAARGYADTSLARIAEAAGVSKAAILYYFDSKNAVIETAYAGVIAALTETVASAMVDAATARDSIEAYVRTLIGYLADHPTHMRVIVETLMARDLKIDGTESQPRWLPLADAIAKAQADGQLRAFNARTYAIALGGAIDAICAETLADPDYPLADATDQLVQLIQRATDA